MQIAVRILLALLFISLTAQSGAFVGQLRGNGIPLADTEAGASTIVAGCVNVLTGTYVNTHNDCYRRKCRTFVTCAELHAQ